VTNGSQAAQRMWVYDAEDNEVARVSARLDTNRAWAHGQRTADKIGGVTSTRVPMYTYADDWYISTTFHGPLRIGPDGPLASQVST
jgi:hypothetical protein